MIIGGCKQALTVEELSSQQLPIQIRTVPFFSFREADVKEAES